MAYPRGTANRAFQPARERVSLALESGCQETRHWRLGYYKSDSKRKSPRGWLVKLGSLEEGEMANPENGDDKPLSKPGVEENIPVQDGADKVYKRPGTKGRGVILLVSLGLTIVAAILAVRFVF